MRLPRCAHRRGSTDDATLQLLRIDALPAGDAPHPQLRREGLAMPPQLAPRMEFEGFTILRELQVSARSHLHLAVDQVSGQQYVIKTPSVDMQANPAVRTAFVSTNSLFQGEQVAALWSLLLPLSARIHFAHRTFKWSNEGKGVAAVHCVIVGFALCDPTAPVRVFDYAQNIAGDGVESSASRLNPYLVEGPDLLIDKRRKPLQASVPEVPVCGSPRLNMASITGV